MIDNTHTWMKIYSTNENLRQMHVSMLDELECGNSSMSADKWSKRWISLSYVLEKYKACHMFLDCQDVPRETLTLEERIVYYQLINNEG